MAVVTQPVVVIRRPTPTTIGTIAVDVSMKETHDLSNTITDHPVEEGFNPSDHSRPDPDQLTLECIVSNTPLSVTQQLRAIQSGAFSFQSSAGAPAPRNTPGIAEGTWKQLRAIRDSGEIVTVVTGLDTYASMGLQKLSAPRDSNTIDALVFTATFKLIRVVQNKLTRNVVAKDPRVGAKVKTGNQTPAATGPEESTLFKAANSDTAKDMSKSSNPIISAVGQFGVSAAAGPQ